MFEKMIEKLHKKDGASISFALFAFIVATIVSLIIVTAALTNVLKTRQEKENEQAYLIAESVANLISEQIIATDNGTTDGGTGKNFTNRFVRIQETEDGMGNTQVAAAASTEGVGDMVLAEPFASLLADACEERYKSIAMGNANKTAGTEVSISVGNVTGTSDAKLSDDVVGDINSSDMKITCYMPEATLVSNAGVVDKNVSDYYDIEFLIEVPMGSSKVYKCRLHFDAVLTDADGKATYVYWPKSTLKKGE